MLKDIIKLADHLDKIGQNELASEIDDVLVQAKKSSPERLIKLAKNPGIIKRIVFNKMKNIFQTESGGLMEQILANVIAEMPIRQMIKMRLKRPQARAIAIEQKVRNSVNNSAYLKEAMPQIIKKTELDLEYSLKDTFGLKEESFLSGLIERAVDPRLLDSGINKEKIDLIKEAIIRSITNEISKELGADYEL
jgi:hypothetical protein